MRRWPLVCVGLALAGAAAYLLLGRGPVESEPELPELSAPPLDEIDDASRQELQRILREEGR
ncbi:MAG: hypothetical protein MJE66_17035 [Proteobacteria bacterium]|nr:hypothetical protein [Pseudomonadota bacterium]